MSEAGQDVLAAGSPPRLGRAATATLLALVLLLSAGGWWRYDAQRRQEFGRVASCVAGAQAALASASARVSQIAAYIQPALGTGTAELDAGLYRLVEDAAAATLPPLARARDGCRAARIHPWQGAVARGRSAYLAYLDARVDALADTAGQGAAAGTEHPEQERLLRQARRRLVAAAPDDAGGRRIERLLR